MSITENIERKLLAVAIVLVVAVSFFISPKETFSQASMPITGWAWSGGGTGTTAEVSGGVGWISFHCSNPIPGFPSGVCSSNPYGLSIAANGTISGYAWSDNVGWITANSAELTGCPTAPCTARMDELSMEGWMKAVSGGAAQSGGWDGFISLSGTTYGPVLSATADTFSGYAWGDVNVGWVSFSAGATPARTDWLPPCATQYQCVAGNPSTSRQNTCQGSVPEACTSGLVCLSGGCTTPQAPSTPSGDELKITPNLVGSGSRTNVTWEVSDATSCTVTENHASINDSWSGISSVASACTHSGTACQTSPILGTVTYTLTCTGPGGTLTQSASVYTNPSWREI